MKRKSLFAVALLLVLSTVAFSNERTRYRCDATSNLPCPAAAASKKAAPSQRANADEGSTSSAGHMLLHTFIKLLYI